jgi:hypothetical protein
MIALPRPASVADLVPDPGPPRSAGVHVSTLVKRICQQLEPDRFANGEMDWNRIEFGSTLERVIEEMWQRRRRLTVRPGEIQCDGIIGSPDAVTFEDGDLIVDEIKATWMTSRGCPEDRKFWHWLVQVRAYCWMLQTERARLHVFFVNGNYRDERAPQFLVWDLLFDRRELQENWQMLVNASADVKAST